MLLAEIVIPQMFSAYAEDNAYLANGLHHYQYFCEECDQVFASAWGRIPGAMSYYERGNYFRCPNCGHEHHKYVAYIDRNEKAPNKIRLSVKEYKSVVTLEVSSETAYFPDYLFFRLSRVREVFRFNIAKQTVTFSVNDGSDNVELGNPFRLEIFPKSILRFFTPNSLANSNLKTELNHILKVLRDTVRRKLEKRLGHRVTSMYVSPGQYWGMFLLPIFNIAYRVACPDAPNLPESFRTDHEERLKRFWDDKMLSTHAIVGDAHYFDDVMTYTRRNTDFVTALSKVFSLPQKPMVRRLLAEDPFGAKILSKSFAVCQNYDNAISLYKALTAISIINWFWNADLFKFLKKMRPIYGEPGIVRMVADVRDLRTRDCMRLYEQLNPENKKALRKAGVRLRDLHDWLSIRHQKQTHVNKALDVPDHIVKRLSMQTDRLKFFLPKESVELLEAGCLLHNCVASYGTAMKDQSLWIVLVADDKGKLAACLEIKGNELVQAMLDKNIPVRNDVKLNEAVLAWAQDAGINIKTSDVNKPAKSKNKEKVPA